MNQVKNLTLIEVIIPRIENRALNLVKDIALILSFAALTGIGAKLKLEIGTVPVTTQTLFVILSGALLGSIRGGLAQLTYLLGGLAGIPWFARGGGLWYLTLPTFGYIIGFVLAAYLVGWLCERGFDRKVETAVLAMLAGNVILYLPGLLWLARFVGFERVFEIGLYPFVFGDLLKIFLAGLFLSTGWKFIKQKE